jgi:hypothetical protein
MREPIYDSRNRVIGYLTETANTIDVHDATNRKVGYYSKAANITYKGGNFFGRGDQTMRLLAG